MPERSDTQLSPGSLFADRYRVEALVGSGGMGAVYRVFDESLDERVALKTLTVLHGDPRELERFRREVRLARRITHRNVARTFDLGLHQGTYYLTMELIEGSSLRARLRDRGKLSPHESFEIAAQIADGLAAAHDAGVVHRDLKLANVLIEKSGRVAIVDFGVAKSIRDDQTTGQVVGTPAYMAPEQLDKGSVDARTDLYALGIVLHEMLTGSLPSWGGGRGEVLARLRLDRPELRLERDVGEITLLLRRMLSRDPDSRPSTAREVAALLRAACAAERTVVDHPASPGEPSASAFAPLPERGNLLAVIPFQERGDDSDLGAQLSEALVDVLSRTRGLRVLSMRATAHADTRASPAEVGRSFGAGLVVYGTLQRRRDEVRVTARLVDVSNGVQLWSQRFETRLEDVLEFEDEIGQRIAEALRLELAVIRDRGAASLEAIEMFLAGRRKAVELASDAVEVLEHARSLAPGFRPIVAALALARVRRLFASLAGTGPSEEAEAAVAVALARAADFPDCQLAAGMLASVSGDFVAAARHLRTAVTIAPTSSEAQAYLGHLQLEAGREDEGLRRLTGAMTLDPLTPLPAENIARYHLLHGRVTEYESAFAELERRTGGHGPVWLQLRIRAAAWLRDAHTLKAIVEANEGEQDPPIRMLLTYAGTVVEPALGRSAPLEAYAERFASPRFRTFVHELAAEVWGLIGEPDRALAQMRAAADGALTDVTWLERCPALAEARRLPAYPELLARVKERTRVIWAV